MGAGGSIIGSQPYFNDAVAAAVQQIAAQASMIVGMKLVNTTGAVAYLQVFAAPAANVTLGTTVPLFVIRLQANESITLYDGAVPVQVGQYGQSGQGLSIAGTTTAGGNTGAAISVTMFYV